MTALLEYIDLFCNLQFFKQGFIAWLKNFVYYAKIMLNAFGHLLCSKLCQHNRWVPSNMKQLSLLQVDDRLLNSQINQLYRLYKDIITCFLKTQLVIMKFDTTKGLGIYTVSLL